MAKVGIIGLIEQFRRKRLDSGIDINSLYSAEIARLSEKEIKSFRRACTNTPFCDFQIYKKNKITIPAFDAYLDHSQDFIKLLFENKEVFEYLFNRVKHFKQDEVLSIALQYANNDGETSFDIERRPSALLIRAAYEFYGDEMPKAVAKRVKKIEKFFSIQNLLKSNNKNITLYENGEEFSVSKKELLDLILEDDEKFETRLSEGNDDYNYKLIKALNMFLSQGEETPVLLDRYAFLGKHIKRFERIYDEILPICVQDY